MNDLGAKEIWFGYGVTVNIAASHVTKVGVCFTASSTSVEGRGSSGFDSPYPNSFFQSFDTQWSGGRDVMERLLLYVRFHETK